MAESRVAKYFLAILLLVFLYLSFQTAKPLVTTLIISLILVFIFYPIYEWMLKKLRMKKNLSSLIMVLLVLLLIVIPGGFILNSLVTQTYSAYSLAANMNLTVVEEYVPSFILDNINLDTAVQDAILKVKNLVVDYGPSIIGSIIEMILGLFIMLFVMFYAFRDGREWIRDLKEYLPMKKKYVNQLFLETDNLLSGVLYGYVLSAIIQGSLAGLLLFLFGIPNPVFWGFIMIVFSILPLIGTALVWAPAGLMLIYQGQVVAGVFMLIIQTIIANMDVVIRPKLISHRANIHPVVVLIGVVGGVTAFGFIGVIIGPIIISIMLVLTRFFLYEFKNKNLF